MAPRPNPPLGLLSVALALVGFLLTAVEPSPASHTSTADEVVLVEPGGKWHIRQPGQADYVFWYGMAGDVPLLGDWDGDGWDTPGMYRPATGFVYLSNELPPNGGVGFGDPALTFYFGMRGDQVVVGDWDQDGRDTLGIRRNGRMYLTNRNATGVADVDFWFGHPDDLGFGGDADGNGEDVVFVYRPNNSFVYYTNFMPAGSGTVAFTNGEFYFGVPTDRFVIGDWDGDRHDTVGVYRPGETRVYLRNTLNTGPADVAYVWGHSTWMPVAGRVGTSVEPTTTTTTMPSPTTTTVPATTTTTLPPPRTYHLRTYAYVDGLFGSVVSDPPGIVCVNSRAADCEESFPAGTNVTLTATPSANTRFDHWEGGGCGTANPCTLTMTADMLVYPIWAEQLPIRVNAGGPQIASPDGHHWRSDTRDSPSPYLNFSPADPENLTTSWPQPGLDRSVPPGTPAEIFTTERYDNPDNRDMHWSIPVEADQCVEVRLYFASGYPGASEVAERLFDVTIDDSLVLNDYDIVADVGHQVGVMKQFVVRTDADGLDIHFSHTDPAVQNPLINAIEVTEAQAPLQLALPIGGKPLIDWVIVNYVDHDPTRGRRLDYMGGTWNYDGHNGTDFTLRNFQQMDQGVNVYAAADGVVHVARDGAFDRNTCRIPGGTCVGSSNRVGIQHADGSTTRYFHLRKDSVLVSVGDPVVQGQKIAEVGSSGNSTDPHLHFEVRDPGWAIVDPFAEESWLPGAQIPYAPTTLSILDGDTTDHVPTRLEFTERPPPVESFTGPFTDEDRVAIWVQANGRVSPSNRMAVRLLRPDGSEHWSRVHSEGTIWWYGHATYLFRLDLLSEAQTGTWHWTVEKNGVVEISRSFTIDSAL